MSATSPSIHASWSMEGYSRYMGSKTRNVQHAKGTVGAEGVMVGGFSIDKIFLTHKIETKVHFPERRGLDEQLFIVRRPEGCQTHLVVRFFKNRTWRHSIIARSKFDIVGFVAWRVHRTCLEAWVNQSKSFWKRRWYVIFSYKVRCWCLLNFSSHSHSLARHIPHPLDIWWHVIS